MLVLAECMDLTKMPPTSHDIMQYDPSKIAFHLEQTHQTPYLSEREKQLIGLAVTLTRGCQTCTRHRIEKGLQSGLSQETIQSLIEVTSAVNSGVTAATAREALNSLNDSGDSESCQGSCAQP